MAILVHGPVGVARRDVVVVGGSAGAIEVLRAIVAELPHGFDAAVFVVTHTSPDAPGILASILNHAGPLSAEPVLDGERIEKGRIFVAPPDRHLILEPGRVRLTHGPKENRFRPAIDPLFRSAAQVYGPRVIGVILSGGLDDGTAGLLAIKKLGGTAIVQDPLEAYASSMPSSALRHVRVDHCVSVAEIAPLLVRLVSEDGDEREGEAMDERLDIEVKIAKGEAARGEVLTALGTPSPYACPECHGVLMDVSMEGPDRFRCHTGHAYTAESLLCEFDDSIESALWNAIRSLEERLLLVRQLEEQVRQKHGATAAEQFERLAHDTKRRAELVRAAALRENAKA